MSEISLRFSFIPFNKAFWSLAKLSDYLMFTGIERCKIIFWNSIDIVSKIVYLILVLINLLFPNMKQGLLSNMKFLYTKPPYRAIECLLLRNHIKTILQYRCAVIAVNNHYFKLKEWYVWKLNNWEDTYLLSFIIAIKRF